MRRRVFQVTVLLVALLAMPALAQASMKGTVLSVDPARHQVQIVGANEVVSAYDFTGHPNGLGRGTRVSYTPSGTRATNLEALGRVSTFSFLATVVRSGGNGLVLALGDQRNLRLTTKSTRGRRLRRSLLRQHCSCGDSTPTVNIEIRGLASGETVVVTESTSSSGSVTITITLPSGGGAGSGSTQTATGDVNNVNDDTFDIITADGSDLNFHMAATPLANLDMSPCDSVVVSYHTDDNIFIADSVVDNGPSDDGSCGDDSDSGDDTSDAIGTITALSDSSITIDAGVEGGGVQTFTVDDPSIVDGFQVGDSVDVTYEQDGDLQVADDVEYDN